MPESENLTKALELNGRVLYSKCLGKTLSSYIRELNSEYSPFSLAPELELARALVIPAMRAFEESVAEAERSPGATPLQIALVAYRAADMVYDSLAKVRDMAVAHRKVVNDASISPIQVQAAVIQVVQDLDSRLQEYAPQMRQIGLDPSKLTKGLAEDLRLPRDPAKEMTEIEPWSADEEALAMDSTVPLYLNGKAS